MDYEYFNYQDAMSKAFRVKNIIDIFLEDNWDSHLSNMKLKDVESLKRELRFVINNSHRIYITQNIVDSEMFLCNCQMLLASVQEYESSIASIPHDSDQFVYLIKANIEDALYKIGKTNNIESRYKALSTMSPVSLEILHLIRTRDKDVYKLEKYLHEKYDNKRHHGEWFVLSDEDVQEICSMKGIRND